MRRGTLSPIFLDPAQTTLPHGSIAPDGIDTLGANVAEVLWAAGWCGLMPPYPPSLLPSRFSRVESVVCSGVCQKAFSDDEDLL